MPSLKYSFFWLSLEPKIKFEPEIIWLLNDKLIQIVSILQLFTINWKSLKFEILTYFLGMHTKLLKAIYIQIFQFFFKGGNSLHFFPFFLQRGKQSELCHLVILKCSPKQLDFILLGVEQLKQAHYFPMFCMY